MFEGGGGGGHTHTPTVEAYITLVELGIVLNYGILNMGMYWKIQLGDSHRSLLSRVFTTQCP